MNAPRGAPLSPGALALALCLGLGSTTALAAADEPPVAKGTVLVEGPIDTLNIPGTAKRISCEGPFCLWLVVEELGPCFYGLCTNKFMVLSDLEGKFMGASRSLDSWTESTPRFIDAEHVEVVSRNTNYPFTAVDDGLDPTQVSRTVLKVSRDGTRFTQAPSLTPTWTKPGSRRMGSSVAPKPPEPRVVSAELLARARALCPTDVTFNPVDYACGDGTCLLLLTESEPKSGPDAGREEATAKPTFEVEGPFCSVMVKGEDVELASLGGDATSVRVTPTGYAFSGPVGMRGSTEVMEWVSRARPGYMSFSDTEGVVVNGSNPYPVRFAESAKAALALAPTVQAFTLAHVTWGLADWKGPTDLAFAWRLARVGEALALIAEVHDDKVVPLGKGTGLHSDHLELTFPRPSVSPSHTIKVGVLLTAGGKVEARDWTGEANPVLPSIQGTWRKRPHGYEVSLTLPLAALGVEKSARASYFSLAVSDADARGKQETLMGHDGELRFWTEYPPSIAEYRGSSPWPWN
ncbi:hypothetical protein [Myxococcus eversor]|uniref:hypothetical protein n=1 Tax=Myxococcus eversor TaxID=2709661 RepID=UPI0013D32E33|nr:hypothetical protein [Myxococcus eversor]